MGKGAGWEKMRTHWSNWMPTHDFVDKRRDVGQRHFVIKIGKPARPHDIVNLLLCPSLSVRVKNHSEKEREERSDGLT